MANVDDLILQALQEMTEPEMEDDRVFCTIDPQTRKIAIPQEVSIFAVTSDANTNRIWFKCPRYVGDKFDLTKCTIRVNYITPAGDKDSFYTQLFEKIGDDVVFSWLIPRRAVKRKGTLSFVVCALLANEEGVVTEEWNTAIANAQVLEGIEPEGCVEKDEEVKDAVAQVKSLVTSGESFALRAETAANLTLETEARTAQSEANAKASETNAAESEAKAAQSFADMLRMMGSDIATLVGGKIPVSQIPAIATTEVYSVNTEAERDALEGVERGDICVVSYNDETKAKSFIYNDGWVYLASPTDYAAKAGYADTAETAESANAINGHRLVQMKASDFATAVLDPETYYLVWSE